MIYYELELFGRFFELPALVLDPADGELGANTGLNVQPLVRKRHRLVEPTLSDEEQPVLRVGANIASPRLQRP